MKTIIAAIALALSLHVAQAQEAPEHIPVIGSWSATDIALEATVATVFLIDHNQTRQIKNHPGLHESNIFLGKHPSDTHIRNHFLLAMVGHAIIVNAMGPGKLRTQFQAGTVAVEMIVIGRNKKLGLNIKF